MAKDTPTKEKKPAGGGKPKHDDAAASNEPAQPARLRVKYVEEVRKALAEEFGVTNPMAQPRLQKIVLNVNIGRHLDGNKMPANVKDTVVSTLTKVSAQKPILLTAKKSVSNFKVREGADTAYMVTLRRDRMWHFLDRLINLGLPRVKDFRGVSDKAFDAQGNYSMGLSEQGVFPEINMADVNFTHGMNINMCFSNSDPKKSRFALEKLGFPFKKPEERRKKS
jgi:large subunit ribosomal protein L5